MTLTLPAETEVRLQTLVALRNQSPEAVIDAALEALLREPVVLQETIPGESSELTPEEHQARLRHLLLAATEDAKHIQAEPADSAARIYYREHLFAQGVAEKMRRQGFDVDW